MRRRMILAPTPRERGRWYAILLASDPRMERDPHTTRCVGPAFGEGGIFQRWFPPALEARRSRRR